MLKNMFLATVLLIPLLFAAGCDNQGPAEKAGEKIDNAMEEVRDKAEDVVDKAEDVIDRAEDKVSQ